MENSVTLSYYPKPYLNVNVFYVIDFMMVPQRHNGTKVKAYNLEIINRNIRIWVHFTIDRNKISLR